MNLLIPFVNTLLFLHLMPFRILGTKYPTHQPTGSPTKVCYNSTNPQFIVNTNYGNGSPVMDHIWVQPVNGAWKIYLALYANNLPFMF